MGLLVIALGGNALLSPSGAQSFRNEGRSIDKVCRSIALLAKRHRIILTHGNGSQVGDELVRNERAKSFVPKMPLYLLNAETQATIGSMLETSLRNSLGALRVKKEVSVVFSHTLVDLNDPAFRKPTKPVSPLYQEGARCRAKGRQIPLHKDRREVQEGCRLAKAQGDTGAEIDRGV